jgi:hypothetical protein
VDFFFLNLQQSCTWLMFRKFDFFKIIYIRRIYSRQTVFVNAQETPPRALRARPPGLSLSLSQYEYMRAASG